MNKLIKKPLIATVSYIVLIVLLNSAMVYLPVVTILGERCSVADIFVGSIYLVRDFAQREIHHYVFLAMLIGALLSFLLAGHAVAVASVSAFLVGEMVDWAVYTFTKRPLSTRLVLSACLSAPLDTAVFLYFMQRLNWVALVVMVFGKLIGVFVLWGVWKYKYRALRYEF